MTAIPSGSNTHLAHRKLFENIDYEVALMSWAVDWGEDLFFVDRPRREIAMLRRRR